ncbi:MAG TPA: HAD family phosphatase [Candidatus Hydrogenedentes bacterium]|jgi:HAD superfamily hydrolase (TIGR01509 family)|nr:MAG: Phosphorylated carbohydrates phosphatase [Candidatus Hydrogenedentes bacterium ADurb.Bin101]HOC67883.1 HAD family phosphatase [Candidatus Hydrogenedentota bacterium]HQN00207.1 HAD family phosphatase [Candidatus Hydrogenedentota bacterium]
MIDAYFFDMDGTLVDTEILWVEAMELLAKDHGYTLSRDMALHMVYGISWPGVYDRLREQFPEIHWTMEEMGAMIGPYFYRLRDTRDVRIQGSIDLLKRLAKTRLVAVVSGSYRADVDTGIAIAGVGPDIRFFLGHEDYDPGKPHPACYLAAAEHAGVPPEHCVVFEDSNAGVCAAKDAGAYAVALSRPGRPAQDYSRADLVLEDLSVFEPEMLASEKGS